LIDFINNSHPILITTIVATIELIFAIVYSFIIAIKAIIMSFTATMLAFKVAATMA